MNSRTRATALGAVALCLALLVGSGVPATAGAATTPSWLISQSSVPTNLIPGAEVASGGTSPSVFSTVTNVGTGRAEEVVITDLLPTGLTTSPQSEPSWVISGAAEPCEVTLTIVTCKVGVVAPGQLVNITVPLAVTAMPGALTNRLLVESESAPETVSTHLIPVSTDQPAFKLLSEGGLFGGASVVEGAASAGEHPPFAFFGVEVPRVQRGNALVPVESLRSVGFDLPQGLVVNPAATRVRCTDAQLNSSVKEVGEPCPAESMVGLAFINLTGRNLSSEPIYNMVPPPGAPAELAFAFDGSNVHIVGGLGGDFHLTAASAELLTRFETAQIAVELWGNTSDPIHDASRRGSVEEGTCDEGCQAKPSPAPFLSMPSSCTEPMILTGRVVSWLGTSNERSVPFSDAEGVPVGVKACGGVTFGPTISSKATTASGESPSGLDFSIHQPQDESLEGRSTAALKDATVTLPAGMTLNPSASNGLSSCSEQQMGYAPEEGKIRFQTGANSCPDASKVGTISVHTPLLEEDQLGAIYVAKPFDNPFGSLLAIYLAVEDETTGIVAKLAGRVTPDPKTGHLTATFTESPELPIEDIDLHFFSGDRGVLTTPLTCGPQTTTSTLTPWSTPEGADAHPSDSFGISGGCSSSEASAPRPTSLTAGTQTPLSGVYSPFVLRISRPDGSQHITGIEATLPSGLLGKLAGVAYCPESGIAQAISREHSEQGKLEQSSPSCPQSSEVGTVQVTAGSGSSPIPVSGHAYLAGPYKGAPLSLVAIVPAVAGPFDLGTVVDRVALNVGEYDARIHAVSDPLPTIREGIPLDARSIEVNLDRPGFTLNPTSCEAMQIEGSVTTQTGQSQPLSNRFQVGECGRLAFKPKLQLSLKGPTRRTGHPAVKAVVTFPEQGAYANLARAQVNLPHSEFLDQGNIGKACTKALIAQEACPAKSIYGKAKAWSPLLDKPLEGPVYLVGGYGYKLPALVAELNGQIRVLLVGKVDTGKNKGIRNTFEAVPDAPVSRFVLELKGGKKYGLLENSEDVCRKTQKAGVSFRAQNGKVLQVGVKIFNSCGKRKPGTGKSSKEKGKS